MRLTTEIIPITMPAMLFPFLSDIADTSDIKMLSIFCEFILDINRPQEVL